MINGSISLIPIGGSPPYMYLWSNGETSAELNNLVPGLYHVTLVDACSNEYYDSILIEYEPNLLEYNIDYTSPSCISPLGSITITELNSLPFNSWLINNNGDTIEPISQGDFNNLPPGIYYIFVQDTFSCNTDTFIAELSEFIVDINTTALPSVIQCSGNSVLFESDISVYSPNICNWYNDNNELIGEENPLTISVDYSGYYYCEVLSCSQLVLDSVYVNVLNISPVIELGPDKDLCYGDSIGLDYNSAYSYTWNNFNTTNTISVLQTGQYIVTVSDGVCSVTDSIFINVENTMPNPVYDSSLCATDSTIVYFDSAYSYLWSDGSTENILFLDTAGIYLVTVTSENCSNEFSLELELSNYPESLLDSVYNFCSQVALLNPGIASEYEWTNGYLDPVLYVFEDGIYSVTMTSGSCSVIDSTVVNLSSSYLFDLGQDTFICNGLSVFLDAGNFTQYLWSTGETTQNIEVYEANTYWVTVSDEYFCSSVDSVNVFVIYDAVSLFSFSEAYGTVQFVNQSQNSTDFIWNFGDGSFQEMSENPIHTYPSLPYNEFYTVSLIAGNICSLDT